MKQRVCAVLIGVLLIAHAPTAHAHVLVTEPSTSVSAILHVRPGDDPVAGEPSELFFDVQGAAVRSSSVQLSVTDQAGAIVNLPVRVVGNTVSSDIIFPSQGVYKLVLTFDGHTLQYSQRVSRGPTTTAPQATQHQIAELLLIVSASLLVTLVIIAVNRRRAILELSR